METYLLIVTVALFLGVMGIIAMLERRRRTDQAHFEQLHQVLSGCLVSLQETHTSNRSQSAQLNDALVQLQATIEANANNATESRGAAAAESVRTIQTASDHLRTVVVQHQKAMDATLVRAAEQLSASASARSKELVSEAQRTTKAVEDLRASLEESVKFDTKP